MSTLTPGESKMLGIAQRMGDLLIERAGPDPDEWEYDDRQAMVHLLGELAQARQDDPESWEADQ